MPRNAPEPNTTAGAFLRGELESLSHRLRKAADKLPAAEAVHELRVSARRLRALISNFRTFLPMASEEIRARLKELASGFSEVRDLDVMLGNLRDWRRKLEKEHRPAFHEVLKELASRRDTLLQKAYVALDAWRGTVQDAGLKMLAQHGDEWPPESEVPVRMVALGQLATAHNKFQKALLRARRDRKLEQYHELRIHGKKLRYVLQALTEVYGKPARQMLKDLEALQDGFGAYLDAEVAAITLEKRIPGLSADARKAATRMAEICRARATKRLGQMPGLLEKLDEKRWKRFMGSFGGSG
jgi:CHAD domain-containing protein